MRCPVRLSVALSLLAMALLLGESIAGMSEGLAMLTPALAFALPLLVDRYLGEDLLDRVRATVPPTPRGPAAALAVARRPQRLLPRGGALLAASLATRPPPAAV
jgi:hypothetical protein